MREEKQKMYPKGPLFSNNFAASYLPWSSLLFPTSVSALARFA